MNLRMGLYSNLYKKEISVLFASVLVIGSFSCQKEVIGNQAIKDPVAAEVLSGTTISPNLIFEESFEDGTAFTSTDYATLQKSTSYGFTINSSTAFDGSKSGRFELRDTDTEASGGTRAEAKFPEPENLERWYSYNVYFPSSDWAYDQKAEIISQWHQSGGVSPSMSIITRYDKMVIEVRTVPDVKTQYPLGSIVKDKWQTFVYHVKHSHGSDGLIEIWQNGTKIFSRTGANGYDMSSTSSFDRPKLKLGIYKWDWNGTETTDVSKRVIYFDNVRVGNENAAYADMVSGSTTTPPTEPTPPPTEPTPPPTEPTTPPSEITAPSTGLTIDGFVLVNSAAEKDVVTITEGATISLAKYGLTKVNIRTIAGSASGSVNHALSGPTTRSFTDNDVPYALWGDDGHGNFYYGSWGPPVTGSYTLVATPYTGEKATGTKGASKTIHFTITK